MKRYFTLILSSLVCLAFFASFAHAKINLQFFPNSPDLSISINGEDSDLINQNENVNITINLLPGSQEISADYWIVASTGDGWYSLVYNGQAWVWQSGIKRLVNQALPIIEIRELDIAGIAELPFTSGLNYMFFAVDENADGELDATWWDKIEVFMAE